MSAVVMGGRDWFQASASAVGIPGVAGSDTVMTVSLHGGPLTVNQHKIIQNLVDKHISALTEYAKQWNKPPELLLRTAVGGNSLYRPPHSFLGHF